MHVGEAAEVYALGLLDDRERAEVEAHIAQCATCSRRVGEAEETLLALEREHKPVPMPSAGKVLPLAPRRMNPAWWIAPAIAAAFVLGFLFPRHVPQSSAPTLAMIESHFSHAQFNGIGPPAKVIYARDRSWYYIIVSGNYRFNVYGIHGTNATLLGTTAPAGATSALFERSNIPFERIELRDRSGAIEGASLR
ncbi:MAG TPA: zf-HC2 domain-containing protein [Candidatus Cybelea sp.]